MLPSASTQQWEREAMLGLPARHRRKGGGGGGGSSLVLYANQQDPRAQMSRDRAGGEAEACTAPMQPSERGCVSSAMMS